VSRQRKRLKINKMTQIEILSENLASSILEENFLSKEDLQIKIRAFLKTMMDMKNIERSSSFKETTLDWVASISNKNKFRALYWEGKVKELAPEKIKSLRIELSKIMGQQDFSSKRKKKALNLQMNNINP